MFRRSSEWGGRGRHRKRTRVAVAAGSAVLVVAAAGGAWAVWFRSSGPSPGPGASRKEPACATGRVAGNRLGRLAWVRDGKLSVSDLDACTERTLVRSGARPPVRFSPDGRWIAFGAGTVIPSKGGSARQPLGSLASWQWAQGDVLIGVARNGAVVLSEPTAQPRTLLRKGAQDAALSPDGDVLAAAVGPRLVTVPATGGPPATLFRTHGRERPEVAGWTPGNRWVLFWVRSPHRPSAPLHAAPVSGGGYTNVFDPVLPYPDFLSWCEATLALSGGGKEFPSEGQQLLTSSPPTWSTHNLSADFRKSWLWPSCSPDGAWIAVTVTPNGPERPPGYGSRSLWLISVDGGRRVRLARGVHFAFEAPRWSSDGRYVMAVRRERDPRSPGSVLLYQIDTKTGKLQKTIGPIAVLGPAPGTRGHTAWTSISDWYR